MAVVNRRQCTKQPNRLPDKDSRCLIMAAVGQRTYGEAIPSSEEADAHSATPHVCSGLFRSRNEVFAETVRYLRHYVRVYTRSSRCLKVGRRKQPGIVHNATGANNNLFNGGGRTFLRTAQAQRRNRNTQPTSSEALTHAGTGGAQTHKRESCLNLFCSPRRSVQFNGEVSTPARGPTFKRQFFADSAPVAHFIFVRRT